MLIEHHAFPMRPIRLQGESLAGYVCRHYGVNGHWVPEALHRAISTIYRGDDSIKCEEAWTSIRRVIGHISEQDQRMWINERVDRCIPESKNRLWLKVKYRTLRLCPNCLRQFGVHSAIWDLPLVHACPMHGCLLAVSCNCGRKLDWRSVAPGWTCICGIEFATITPIRAGAAAISLASAILSIKGIPHLPGYTFALPPNSPLHQQSLAMCFEDIQFLFELRNLIAKSSIPTLPQKRDPDNPVGRLLNDWPHVLRRSINRLLCFQSRSNNLTIYGIKAESSTAQLLSFMELAAAKPELSLTLRECMREIVNSINTPLKIGLRIIFNPAIPVPRRDANLLKFKLWWCEFAQKIEFTDENIDAKQPSGQSMFPKEMVGEFVTLTLSHLVEAAVHDVPVQALRRVALAWPASLDISKLEPIDLFKYLTLQLHGISINHLGYLSEMTTTQNRMGIGA
jgi:hypothetical protein